jgi:hypothetical protein
MTDAEMWRRICHDYRLYDAMPAFLEGVRDYDAHKRDFLHWQEFASQLNGQAWARGANARMRFLMWKRDPKLYAERYPDRDQLS